MADVGGVHAPAVQGAEDRCAGAGVKAPAAVEPAVKERGGLLVEAAVRLLSPLPWRTRMVPAWRSTSRSSSASASEIRRPVRHSTAISARLRIPVGARAEQALISAIASGSESTSGGGRRRRQDELVDGLLAGAGSATAIGRWGHAYVQERDHVADDGQLIGLRRLTGRNED